MPPLQLMAATTGLGGVVHSNGVVRTNDLPEIGVLEIPYSGRSTVDGTDRITVPAGTFNVARLVTSLAVGGETETTTLELARHVGPVRHHHRDADHATERTHELIATETPEHNLALVRLAAPRTVLVRDPRAPRNVVVTVDVQNRGGGVEVVPDVATLERLIALRVEPLGACPTPRVRLHPSQSRRPFPMSLAPRGILRVAFEVTFACVVDPTANTRRSSSHGDYRYSATVDRSVLGGFADTDMEDSVCPRGPRAPDPGCGGRTRGGLGAPVETDLVVRTRPGR